jgi:hypothetical protein
MFREEQGSYQTPTPTATPISTTGMTTVASLVFVQPGFWSVLAKADANGGTAVDCFLMPHSATQSYADTSVALDETTVNPSAGPTAVVLPGLLDTTGLNNGADLLCASTGAVVFSHAKIVAHQASDINTTLP